MFTESGNTKDPYQSTDLNSNKENVILYLFGRTDRQKEEWFYRCGKD